MMEENIQRGVSSTVKCNGEKAFRLDFCFTFSDHKIVLMRLKSEPSLTLKHTESETD